MAFKEVPTVSRPMAMYVEKAKKALFFGLFLGKRGEWVFDDLLQRAIKALLYEVPIWDQIKLPR